MGRLRVLIVQHGEKERAPGDPGLTALGRSQADATARWLAVRERTVVLWSSPMLRAHQTALAISRHADVPMWTDARLRERMNWDGGQPIEAFLHEWQRSSLDRSFRPTSGDSSDDAAARFLAALDDLAAETGDGTAIVVAHGGVTTDVLRTLLGDEALAAAAPGLVDAGVPPCAVTTLRRDGRRWAVDGIASTDHLPAT